MPRVRRPEFPELETQILSKGVFKSDIAEGMGINAQTLSRKLSGRVEFTLKEIRYLHKLFPDVSVETLFDLDRKEF